MKAYFTLLLALSTTLLHSPLFVWRSRAVLSGEEPQRLPCHSKRCLWSKIQNLSSSEVQRWRAHYCPWHDKGQIVEHFSDLLNQPTDADLTIADGIDQLSVIESMHRPIEEQELDQALRNTQVGKSSGPDGILPVILVNGGHCLRAFLLDLFNICWVTEIILLDCIDVNIAILSKKGDRSHCSNYRGISLFSTVGKVLVDVILQRLHLLVESMYPQSQSGYSNGSSTIDGIFTLRQLIEKTREQRRCLYMAFVDFVKVFHTVNCKLLFIILHKLGCPPKFIRIIKKLYTDVHARLIVDGELNQSLE